ncbi:hypothetical protein OROMI_034950 [Orobanche minor]
MATTIMKQNVLLLLVLCILMMGYCKASRGIINGTKYNQACEGGYQCKDIDRQATCCLEFIQDPYGCYLNDADCEKYCKPGRGAPPDQHLDRCFVG